jgi:hypothetical protein
MKEENEKRHQFDMEAEELGDYNPYSRPRASLVRFGCDTIKSTLTAIN